MTLSIHRARRRIAIHDVQADYHDIFRRTCLRWDTFSNRSGRRRASGKAIGKAVIPAQLTSHAPMTTEGLSSERFAFVAPRFC